MSLDAGEPLAAVGAVIFRHQRRSAKRKACTSACVSGLGTSLKTTSTSIIPATVLLLLLFALAVASAASSQSIQPAPPSSSSASASAPAASSSSTSCGCALKQVQDMEQHLYEPARSAFLASVPATPLDDLTDTELASLNERLADASPAQVLLWVQQGTSHLNVTQFTSFGLSGLCITDIMTKLGFDVPIIFIDTLYHFDETLELLERVQAKYGRQVVRYRPMTAQTREEFEDLYGEELWQRDPELYQYMTKVEPTGRALRDYGVNVWITGRRRSQGAVRSQLHVVERTKDGRFKVNPMAFWPFETVQAYIREHNVPYNALLDQGYKSIGDVHSTVPVGSDAPERSGRWSGDYRTECGMHTMLETMGCDDQAGSTTSTATSSGIVSAFSSMLSLAEHNSSPPPQQQQQQQQQHHDSDGGDGDDGGVELHVGKSAMGTGVQQAAVHAQGSMASKVGGAGRGASAADGDGTQADAGARQEAAAISD